MSLERAILAKGVERRAMDILGQAVVFGDNASTGFAHPARDRRGFGEALNLHQ